MTTQSINPADQQIDPGSGLPLVNPNRDMPALNPTPQTTIPPATATPTTSVPTTPPVPTTPGTPSPLPQATPQPLAVVAPVITPPAPVTTPAQSYIVQPGDTISKIASKMGVAPGDISGYASGNPNIIKPGENLQIKAAGDTSQVNAGASSDAHKTPVTTTNPDGTTGTTSVLDSLLKQYGITKPDPNQDPVTQYVDRYTSIATQLGIPDIKTQIQNVIKAQGDSTKEMNDKIDEVNNNPWLSSASRSDEINKIKTDYTPQLQLQTSQLTLYNSLYDKASSQAQYILGQITSDQKNQQDNYDTVVGKAIDIAQKQLDAQTALAKDNQVVSVGGREILVNKETGKKVADLGPSTTSSNSGVGGSPTDIAGWVQAIKSGSAKLSDLTSNPTLKNAVVSALAQGGSSANDILSTTKQSLSELQAMVDKDQGFKGAVGSKLAFGTLFGLSPNGVPGSSEANFTAKLAQVKNDVILPNLTLLHGLGRVTDREFQALTSAVTSLSTNLSEGEFKNELANITSRINAASGGTIAAPTSGTTTSGIKYTVSQ